MSVQSWLLPSTRRLYPTSAPARSRPLCLDAALNEQVSCQIGLHMDEKNTQTVRIEAAAPDGWSVRIRRVGYVPVRHLNTALSDDPMDVEGIGKVPGYVPDPLFDEREIVLPGNETHAFWITIRPATDAAPGTYALRIRTQPERGKGRSHTVNVTLHDVRLAPRMHFPITHWFYADALSDWYRVAPFSEEFWPICRRYMQNYADHGLDMIYVPVFTPPLDGVKSPTQLLSVHSPASGVYRFDWKDVKRWVDLAQSCGIRNFEWTHPFTQWGVKHAIRIYHGQGLDEQLLWDPETGATSDTYRGFLAQFLPELKAFLDQENLLEHSAFHVSDEPHTEEDKANYIAARGLLRELAPWMKTMDALTDIEYGRQHLTDMPVPSIRTALQFNAEGIESWCYYCCGPRGRFLNRLLDTPLAKIGMHGFLFYRWPFKGFLHWGYNYWYRSQTRELIDPYSVQDGFRWPNWAYGDTFVVYPGPDGPVDSLRWEVFSEALQDYQLLQAMEVPRNDQILASLKSFEDFPKTETWRRNIRKRLFTKFDTVVP